jgi:hypothetical protein
MTGNMLNTIEREDLSKRAEVNLRADNDQQERE